ncbi:MAG TPA: hypothetical protein VKQ71_14985, partial [Acidimicrobiales bacterium]|nr:hypothetical protein [Acidimicrobiales bacterium]
MTALTRDVAIAGVGYSELFRGPSPPPRALTFAAARAALDDCGLTGVDIDGIFEYKFGAESPGAQDAARMIGSPNLAAFADIMGTGPSGLAAPLAGVMAVASGVCETVLAYRCITRDAGYTGGMVEGPDRVGGTAQFLTPYGYLGGIMVNMAMQKRRRIAEFGGSAEDFGQIALNARRWSALNPRAALRDPITMDDYLSSRPIVDPLLLLDCDYPVSASVATVITTLERARDLRQAPVVVEAMSFGTGPRCDWVFGDDYLFGGTIPCAR